MATTTTSTTTMKISKMTYSVQDLHQHKNLWYKIHVFVYDLHNYNEIATSHDRLKTLLNASYIDALYIGAPYFKPDEAAMLRATNVKGGKTLQMLIRGMLEGRLMRRMERGSEVCAARDLALIFEKAFCIDYELLVGDTKFLALMAAYRLFLPRGRGWDGFGRGEVVGWSVLEMKKGWW